MKKSLLILFIFAFFSPIHAQEEILIGLDGNWKYAARQQPLDGYSYWGDWSYEIGFSVMKRVRWSRFFWQTGLNFNRFSETLIDFQMPKPDAVNAEIVRHKTVFKRYGVSVPMGIKIFFSDRKCEMFVHPSLSFDYYFREKIEVNEDYELGTQGVTIVSEHSIGSQDLFVASARLAIGGHQPISERIDVLLQLEGTYGLFGTGTFSGNEPWSIGIRAGILYRL